MTVLPTILTPLAVTGTEITFWICAVVAVAGAVGVVASSRPVYSALSLALTMLALAALYASLDAGFLFAVQIIVYTGAILMLFLFVIMLVGVSSRDHLIETLQGHRAAALVAAVGLLSLLVLATGQAVTSEPVGLEGATADGYTESLAQLIFQRYVIAFEATAGLLITAAVAAMVLAHPRRLRPKPNQADRERNRLAAYADSGRHPGPLPSSGVTARHNSIATPALLPDGAIAPESVSATVATRVVIASAAELTAPMAAVEAALDGTGPGVVAAAATPPALAAPPAAADPDPPPADTGADDAPPGPDQAAQEGKTHE